MSATIAELKSTIETAYEKRETIGRDSDPKIKAAVEIGRAHV